MGAAVFVTVVIMGACAITFPCWPQEDHDLEEESLVKAEELEAIAPLDQTG